MALLWLLVIYVTMFGVAVGLEGFFRGTVAWPLRILVVLGGLCILSYLVTIFSPWPIVSLISVGKNIFSEVSITGR